MPNLKGRQAFSNLKAATAEPPILLGESRPGEPHPCLGGCGLTVVTAKCSQCASNAVRAFLEVNGRGAIASRWYA